MIRYSRVYVRYNQFEGSDNMPGDPEQTDWEPLHEGDN